MLKWVSFRTKILGRRRSGLIRVHILESWSGRWAGIQRNVASPVNFVDNQQVQHNPVIKSIWDPRGYSVNIERIHGSHEDMLIG